MDDTVSRAAVIREIMTDVRTDKTACLIHANLICNRIEKLPPAQPEIVRCKDCEHNRLPATSANADCEIFYGMTDQYGFCHMAERREVENERSD